MIIYRDLKLKKTFKKSIIAIGNFDGVHLGHQKVLKEAKKKAKNNNMKFGVLTFEPVPVMFFNNNIKNHRINNQEQKIYYLKKHKLDFLIIIKFNKLFSNLSATDFIKNIIYKKLNSSFIFVSKNFRFGKNRSGDINSLIENEKKYDYKTIITNPLKKNSKILSSSVLRKDISRGNIKKINKFLGREWSIKGRVIRGKQLGRKIGFPTCNIKMNDYILPKLGVYSVKVMVNKLQRRGIANIGYRPTFKGKTLLLEVNIFGLKANLYNKKIIVSFIKFIRPEKKFNDINQLKVQIKKDIIKAKN